MTWTEKGFGLNDYIVIGVLIISWSLYFILPKIFSKQVTVLIFLYSMETASIMDNSFGAAPFDFYDIMDGAGYTGMDLMVYLLYPPFGYFFLYFYQKLKVRGRFSILFISIASLLSLCVEWFFYKMNMFQYKNGYQIIYSICVYLVIQSLQILFYRVIQAKR